MSTSTRAENQRIVDMINAAWGEQVAWIEDTIHSVGGVEITVSAIASKLVRGKLPGRTDVPAFFAGPARGR